MNHNRIPRNHINWQESLADGEARSATTSAPSAPEERDHFFITSPKFAEGCSSSISARNDSARRVWIRGTPIGGICGWERRMKKIDRVELKKSRARKTVGAGVLNQRTTIKPLRVTRKRKLLVMVTIIPLMVTYKPEGLPVLKVQKLNRWLKDALTKAGFKRVMLGSIDLSWEGGFYQPHWHIAMWTSDRKRLRR